MQASWAEKKKKVANDGTGVGVVRELGMENLQMSSTQGAITVPTIHSCITEN